MTVDGTKPSDGPITNTSSPLLTSVGWAPKYTVHDWAGSAKVQAAFKKD
jgi:hypothetical protein